MDRSDVLRSGEILGADISIESFSSRNARAARTQVLNASAVDDPFATLDDYRRWVDGSCAAMAQGPTRFARGLAYAKYVNEKLGANHKVAIVPACGHNARCMFGSDVALPLLFPRDP